MTTEEVNAAYDHYLKFGEVILSTQENAEEVEDFIINMGHDVSILICGTEDQPQFVVESEE